MTIYDGSARELACDLFDRGLGYRVVAGRMPMVSRISMTGQIDGEAEICGGADVVGWVEIGASLVRRRILLLWDALYCRREPCSIVAGNRALLSQGTVLHRHGEGSSYRRVRAMATISGAAYSRKSR